MFIEEDVNNMSENDPNKKIRLKLTIEFSKIVPSSYVEYDEYGSPPYVDWLYNEKMDKEDLWRELSVDIEKSIENGETDDEHIYVEHIRDEN